MVSRTSPKEPADQGGKYKGNNNPFNPILVEDGEIIGDQELFVEEEATEEFHGQDTFTVADQQGKSNPLLVKSKSVEQLRDLERKAEHRSRDYLIKSSSLTDLPKHCKESRLEYLKEEFNHLHLVSKHLQKTKEETLQRMKMLEERQKQGRNYQEDIQQYLDSQGQEAGLSQVPETQFDKSQKDQGGETSQKKKKGIQVGKKPLTRAAKKHNLTPRK